LQKSYLRVRCPVLCEIACPATSSALQEIRYLHHGLLGELRDAVTPEHLEVVKEVYGPNPLKAGRGISGVGEFQGKAQAK
jgi:hypothetical protein